MRITYSGFVGIGTTTPVNLLDVSGAMAIGSYAGTNTSPSGTSLIVSGNVGIVFTSPDEFGLVWRLQEPQKGKKFVVLLTANSLDFGVPLC